MPGPIPARWGLHLLSVLRIVAAFLFMAHGAQKLFAWPASEPREAVALVSGLFTRPVAFVLAGEMAVAYAMAHAPRGFWPIVNHGELAVLYCFLFLYFGAVGGGPWSLDALRSHGDPARSNG